MTAERFSEIIVGWFTLLTRIKSEVKDVPDTKNLHLIIDIELKILQGLKTVSFKYYSKLANIISNFNEICLLSDKSNLQKEVNTKMKDIETLLTEK